jgi:hypothetical protein
MNERPDWLENALDVYRLAWTELLLRWKGPQRTDIQYYVDELKEALLDLKQATIAEEPARALQQIEEVIVLLAELRFRS